MADPSGADGSMILSDRDLVEVSGPDAEAYLQGQLSQDIEAIGPGASALTFVLAPNGKVDSWFRVHRRGDTSFVLDVENGFGETLVERLRRFLIRTDAEVGSVVSGRMASLRGDDLVPPDLADASPTCLVADVRWPEMDGFDLIWRDGQGEGLALGSGRSDEARIAAGVPRMGADIVAGSVPAESGRVVIDLSVSFTKGCYTGQELVARMNSRGGQAPIRLRRLISETGLEVGAEVVAHGAIVGVVTSAAGSCALAKLMRKIGPGDRVSVGNEQAVVGAVPGDDLSDQG